MRLFFGLFFFILASTASPITDDPVEDDGGSGEEEVNSAAPNYAENQRDVKPDKNDVSVSTLEALLRDPKVLHVKSKDLLSGRMNKRLKTMAHLRSEVLEEQNIITMDLRDTKGTPDEHKVKDYFFSAYAVYFPVELVVVSHKDANVMFTTFEDIKHPRIPKSEMKKNVEELFEMHSQVNETSRRSNARDGGTSKLPVVPFNWQHFDNLPTTLCKHGGDPFERKLTTSSYLRFSGQKSHYLCSDKAGIKMIYEVSAFRSLNGDMTGSSTVDNKFLRITSSDNAGGAGFTLGAKTGSVFDEFMVEGKTIGRKLSNVFAYKYEVNIEALGTRALLKYSMPNNNVGLDVDFGASSSQTVGVSGGVEIAKEPNMKVEVAAEKTKTSELHFSMKDFQMIRTADERSIRYKYERPAIRFPKLDEKPDAPTEGRGDFEKALDFIGPTGYNFVPKFDVMFIASPTENGRTEFEVENTVGATLFMLHYRHEGAFEYNTWGTNTPYMDHSIRSKIEVDWSHPVFTGFRPVNLQPGVLGTQAFQVEPDGTLILAEVKMSLISQAFIFTSDGEYKSALLPDLCLDSKDLAKLQPCKFHLSQRWSWKKEKATGHAKPDYTDYLETEEVPKRRLGLSNAKIGSAKIRAYFSDAIEENTNDKNDKRKLNLMKFKTAHMTVFGVPKWGKNLVKSG